MEHNTFLPCGTPRGRLGGGFYFHTVNPIRTNGSYPYPSVYPCGCFDIQSHALATISSSEV
jgi:hypothetical protein